MIHLLSLSVTEQLVMTIVFSILAVLLGLFLLFWVIPFLAVELIFHRRLYQRADGAITIDYPSVSDHKKLRYRAVTFPNDRGELLHGHVYRSTLKRKAKSLIIVVHGLGGGHFYLLPLIDALTRAGFLVLAYDMTGSGMSEGRHVRSLIQAVPDLLSALRYVKKDPELKDLPLHLFGHSWGGYAVLNALHFKEYDIRKCVSVAGFNSNVDLALGKKRSRYGRALLLAHDRLHDHRYAKLDALTALKETDTQVLYLQGEDDHVVPVEQSGQRFAALKNKNVEVRFLKGRGHMPFVTKKAEALQALQLKDLGLFGEKESQKNIHPIDYRPLAEPDPEVVRMIIAFYLS